MEFVKKAKAGFIAAGLVLLWVLSVQTAEAQSSRDRPTKPIGPVAPGMKGQQDQQDERQVQRNAWLAGDERQQEQLEGCFRLSANLAAHSRNIRKMLLVSEVNWKEIRNQYDDLRRGLQSLMEKQEQFAMGLNNGQRSWWEKQLQEIMTLQLQLLDQAEAIDRELNGEKPGPVRMAKAFTDLEGQFGKWNRYYGQIGADMNIQNLEIRSAPGKIRGLPGAQNPGR